MDFQQSYSRDEDQLIVLTAYIQTPLNNYLEGIAIAIDSGATHTVIDLTAFLSMGFDLQKVEETRQVLTGNGEISARIVTVPSFEFLGVTRVDYRVMIYDFLQFGIVDTYNGMLGLDFFDNERLSFDFETHCVSLESLAEKRSKQKEIERLKEKIELLEKQIALMQKLGAE